MVSGTIPKIAELFRLGFFFNAQNIGSSHYENRVFLESWGITKSRFQWRLDDLAVPPWRNGNLHELRNANQLKLKTNKTFAGGLRLGLNMQRFRKSFSTEYGYGSKRVRVHTKGFIHAYGSLCCPRFKTNVCTYPLANMATESHRHLYLEKKTRNINETHL